MQPRITMHTLEERCEFSLDYVLMDKCRYCGKLRDEWDCHGDDCRKAIAKALRRQRLGLPMVANVIRNEIPPGATTAEVITVLSRQRLRARRGNEERRDRKAAEDADEG
jgi:hypothetical protein